MKIRIDDFLTADQISDSTREKPTSAIIRDITLIKASALPFDSQQDRYELTLKFRDSGEETKWLPNKTSLRELMRAFGNETDGWIDRTIKLWTVEQSVQGQIKKVIYALSA